jgi:hypothetical protein
MQPRYPEYPHQHYSAVGAPSIQGYQDLEATMNHRAGDKRPKTIGPSSGLVSMKVMPGVAVLTPKPVTGRRAKNGPMIHSGHTGEKFSDTDNRYSLKDQYIFLGIPAAGSSDLKKKEQITIYTGAGMVEIIATHTLKFGQEFTWLPPPINTPDEVKSIQDTRTAFNRLGAPNYIPTQLVPVDAELLTDTLGPVVDVFVKILKDNATAVAAAGAAAALRDSKNPYQRMFYQAIWIPADNLFRIVGGTTLDLAIGTWLGPLSKKMSIAEIRGKMTAGLQPNVDAQRVKDSMNAMVGFNAAISSAKEAARTVGVALDSAEPGAPFRAILH